MANILIIAGFDPTGQAGSVLDAEIVRAHGHRPLSIITALTAQNDQRLDSVNPVPPDILREQMSALLAQYSIDAVKIGLLAIQEISYEIYRLLQANQLPNIVIDPIIRSSSGFTLLEDRALPILIEQLLPMARLVTPNLDEAAVLSGLKVDTLPQMEEAARRIRKCSSGLESVLVKGGHLLSEKTDILLESEKIHVFKNKSPLSGNLRGTGCILSTAIACQLAVGRSLYDAVTLAKSFLEDFIPRRLS